MTAYVIYPTIEQEKVIEAFFEALDIAFAKISSDDELPEHVIKGIAEGQADFESGRFITFEDFKKKLPIK